MSYKLYEVAIIEQPKKAKDNENVQTPKIVLEPRCIMARGDQDAAVKAALKFNTELKDADPERIDIIVRPF